MSSVVFEIELLFSFFSFKFDCRSKLIEKCVERLVFGMIGKLKSTPDVGNYVCLFLGHGTNRAKLFLIILSIMIVSN